MITNFTGQHFVLATCWIWHGKFKNDSLQIDCWLPWISVPLIRLRLFSSIRITRRTTYTHSFLIILCNNLYYLSLIHLTYQSAKQIYSNSVSLSVIDHPFRNDLKQSCKVWLNVCILSWQTRSHLADIPGSWPVLSIHFRF